MGYPIRRPESIARPYVRLNGDTMTGQLNVSVASSLDTPAFTGTGNDDLTNGGTYNGSWVLQYKVEIDQGDPTNPNTFRWSVDNGTTWVQLRVAITGAAQALNWGVTITFGAVTGHDTGDFWAFNANPSAGRVDVTAAYEIGAEPILHIPGTQMLICGFEAMGAGSNRGTQHVAIGYQTLYSNTTGNQNSGIGVGTLYSNTTGSYNNAWGKDALRDNTAGLRNMAIGLNALRYNTTGEYCIAIGVNALNANTTGGYNVAIGGLALYKSRPTSGAITVFADNGAGKVRATSAAHGLAVPGPTTVQITGGTPYDGSQAATGIDADHFDMLAVTYTFDLPIGWWSIVTEGQSNVAIGYRAGYNNITGASNVFIGARAGENETGSNKLYIMNSTSATPLVYGDFGGGLRVQSQAAAAIAFTVKGAASQSGNLQEWQDSAANVLLKVQSGGHLEFPAGINIVLDTVTGTKIGTAVNQKLGFYNAAPVVQQAYTAVSDPPTQAEVTAIRNALVNLGLMAAS